MVAYLSDDWVEALDRALASARPARAETPESTTGPGPSPAEQPGGASARSPDGDGVRGRSPRGISVQYRVPDGPGGARSWHLHLGPDRLRARLGDAAAPVVVFTQPWTVATAVASGRRSATEAVLAGDIAVSGDASALLPWREALRRAGDALAELAPCTEFPSA